eukprot:363490-Chlamydomonas_euryale.AAC.7
MHRGETACAAEAAFAAEAACTADAACAGEAACTAGRPHAQRRPHAQLRSHVHRWQPERRDSGTQRNNNTACTCTDPRALAVCQAPAAGRESKVHGCAVGTSLWMRDARLPWDLWYRARTGAKAFVHASVRVSERRVSVQASTPTALGCFWSCVHAPRAEDVCCRALKPPVAIITHPAASTVWEPTTPSGGPATPSGGSTTPSGTNLPLPAGSRASGACNCQK